MKSETIEYHVGDKSFKGYIAYPESQKPSPAVIVAHAWRGQDKFARSKADALAKLGYVGFAADLYGDGIETDNNERAAELVQPLFVDRAELQRRIGAAYETVRQNSHVDPNRIGAIGFCFGGLTVIELLRSGVALSGVVAFHALLGDSFKGHHAKRAAVKKLNGKILLQHGHLDPLVSAEDIASVQKEFTDAGIDWQMNIYGQASHAYTNPEANDASGVLKYNEKADKRSWISMINFFKENFNV